MTKIYKNVIFFKKILQNKKNSVIFAVGLRMNPTD